MIQPACGEPNLKNKRTGVGIVRNKIVKWSFSVAIIALYLLFPEAIFSLDKRLRPEGYSWKKLKKIKGGVLKPRGWFYKRTVNKGKIIYRITREKKNIHGHFLTGLTINAVKNVTRRTKLSAALYGAYYIYDYMDESLEVINTWENSEGIFNYYGCEVLKRLDDSEPGIIFRIKVSAIANTKTDTLYVIIFGCPNSDWENSFEIEKVIMERLVLDKDY